MTEPPMFEKDDLIFTSFDIITDLILCIMKKKIVNTLHPLDHIALTIVHVPWSYEREGGGDGMPPHTP